MNPPSETLDGRAAAAFLGVKRQTLYAYVSRGLVRSERGPKGRARLFHCADLERLKVRSDARSGHGPVAGAALRWGEPVLETSVGTIDARGPIFRGVPAVRLASEGHSFESVAELLWSGVLGPPALAWPQERSARAFPDVARRLAPLVHSKSRPLDALALAVPAFALGQRGAEPVDSRGEWIRARALLLRLAACVGLPKGLARVTRALGEKRMAARLLSAFGRPTDPVSVAAIDTALILLADHELNPSSFAVRVTASTGAELHACVSAGFAALSGPGHGLSVERVEAFIAQIGSPARAPRALDAATRSGALLPGFGHRLYPNGDPRAEPLLRLADELGADLPSVRTLRAAASAMKRRGGPEPTVDLGLAALSAALKLPPGASVVLFGMGRCAGWVAHALEQRSMGFLLRPRARYVGV